MSDGGVATGGCLCGAVRYEAARPLREAIACHCGQCLRSHGNFAVYSAVLRDRLRVTEARGLQWFASSDRARRGFCAQCGSSLFWDPLDKDYVALAAGSLDAPTGVVLAAHIFVADKPDFYQIGDGLPQHAGSMTPSGPRPT